MHSVLSALAALAWALLALASCAGPRPPAAHQADHEADHDGDHQHCHESLDGEQCHRHDEPGLVSAPVASSSARPAGR